MTTKKIDINTSHNKLKMLRKRRIRKVLLNTVCIILILCGITFVTKYFWIYTQYEITNDASIDQYITPVNIRISGYIKTVNFTEHQKVKAGDTLIVLDDAEYRIKLSDAEAALEDAIATADVLQSSIKTSRSNIEVSLAAVKESEARQWKLEQDEKRYADLLSEKSVSLQQYQQIKADYDEACAKNALLQKQRGYAEFQSEEIIKKQRNINATIERRLADLQMCKLNLSYTVVTAPYDGYVGRRSLGVGQLVQAGQVLTNIISSRQKWVTANYKETQIADIHVGSKAVVNVDAFPDKKFEGVVTAISQATGSKYSLIPTDNSAGNFVKIQQRIPVRIELRNISSKDNELLRAGMMAQAEIKKDK